MSTFAEFLGQLQQQRGAADTARAAAAAVPLVPVPRMPPKAVPGQLAGMDERTARMQARVDAQGMELPLDEAKRIRDRGGVIDEGTFNRPFSQALDIVLAVPDLMVEKHYSDIEQAAKQRDGAFHKRSGTVGSVGPDDTVSGTAQYGDMDPKPLTVPPPAAGYQMRGSKVAAIDPNAPPLPVVPEFGGRVDDMVQRRGGWKPDMFDDLNYGEAMQAIAAQIDARRKRVMGAWDPTVVSGGSF